MSNDNGTKPTQPEKGLAVVIERGTDLVWLSSRAKENHRRLGPEIAMLIEAGLEDYALGSDPEMLEATKMMSFIEGFTAPDHQTKFILRGEYVDLFFDLRDRLGMSNQSLALALLRRKRLPEQEAARFRLKAEKARRAGF